jgi:hypothetical protein
VLLLLLLQLASPHGLFYTKKTPYRAWSVQALKKMTGEKIVVHLLLKQDTTNNLRSLPISPILSNIVHGQKVAFRIPALTEKQPKTKTNRPRNP